MLFHLERALLELPQAANSRPSIRESQQAKQARKPDWIGDVSRFQVETPRLKSAKHRFYAPSKRILCKRTLPIAHKNQEIPAGEPCSRHKANLPQNAAKAKSALLLNLAVSEKVIRAGGFSSAVCYQNVPFETQLVGELRPLQIVQKVRTRELPVCPEAKAGLRSKKSDELPHQRDSLRGVGISRTAGARRTMALALAILAQADPEQWKRDWPGNDAEHKEIEVENS